MSIRSLKGMPDILPGQSKVWAQAEGLLRTIAHSYGYHEIRTPILEQTALFSRSIGEVTDVVEKEMYSFEDKNGDNISLRPENTASVVRSYMQNSALQESALTRLFYMGPMFRHERPQKGRLRQFHQMGVEALGSANEMLDVEVIACLVSLVEAFGIKDTQLQINSIGDQNCRGAYKEKLLSFFDKNKSALDEKSLQRMHKNPLRIFDSKVESTQTLLKEAPKITQHLCAACEKAFARVQLGLNDLGIAFEVAPNIVRGLDYYNRTAFELLGNKLGAQNAIGGGGRYDDLTRQLGGKDTPAVGFAIGLERLLMLAEQAETTREGIFFIALDDESQRTCLQLLHKLNTRAVNQGIRMELVLGKSLKSGLRYANKHMANVAVIVGEQERSDKKAMVKNLSDGSQEHVAFDAMETILPKRDKS